MRNLDRRTVMGLGGAAAGLYVMGARSARAAEGSDAKGAEPKDPAKMKTEGATAYEARDFSGLLGMKGFSDTALNNHFKLYQGYVSNTSKLLAALAGMEADASSPQYAELKRRLGFEFNGMRLHEYYFGNLGGNGTLDKESPLGSLLARDFGSFEAWRKDFLATGAMRGVGWVVLYQDTHTGRLVNFWITDHEVGHPAGFQPVVVMDVWEHAYMTDYQLDRKAYMQAFLDNLNWDAAESHSMPVD